MVIDDSSVFRTAIANAISKDPLIEVVGMASDPFDARDKILSLLPDIVTLDVEMPRMNGVEFLKQVMPQFPLRAIMVSSLNGIVFDALNAGAIDFVSKPSTGGANFNAFIVELVDKLKSGATVDLSRRRFAAVANTGQTRQAAPSAARNFNGILAIGASTGGTEATLAVLRQLPADIPGTVITQHMPPLFTRMYADRLNTACAMVVKEATDGAPITRGVAYIAPGDAHLSVKKSGNGYITVLDRNGEKVNGHCPSVDVLFNSVAKVCGRDAIGVILTGMGSDGAKGLLAMRKAGAYTIGQDEKSSVVYGMPGVAQNIGAVMKQLPIDQISGEIIKKL